MPIELPPVKRIRWNQAYRIVPSRFPPVGLFDRIADPADLDAVFAIEAMTNPRLREEAGALALIP
ncbi:MAG TPA: RES domain-containing protein, partial [Rhodanobacter sp.]|nr:RES domain-containing protein [Rhodanobacter sp.]